MDILAHALWAGAGLTLLGRRHRLARATIGWTLALAALPDVVHNIPVAAWYAYIGSPADWLAYVSASPGKEPPLPAGVAEGSHHLHCLMHSAPVAMLASGLVLLLRHRFWLPLLGWWSHIVIDVFTHSADFYPSPVFYPVSAWTFDGIAWNTPWFMALNYVMLIGLGLWFLVRARASRRRHDDR